ncbi:MBL fold metallo-hydrolase [Desulfovibrio inopinatus]|uniref:MBL fold metallo-hydrolase n=1 Tax=Desulfovibrio inopinatus TaxID=102109 RepID=UPI0003F95BB9|nr:MBL fold metallo-hydrolase [Desulfovibrio inopinatus]
MRITMWGVRGSIPAPGPETVRYGGNTTCLEVVTSDDKRIILDAGSGIRALGLELAKNMPLSCDIFITHTHWDHIQGLPFFVPLFVPNNDIRIRGTFDPVSMKGIDEILAVQMEYCYFPVRSTELKANIRYDSIRERQTIQVGTATVSSILMNHPVLTFGYKIEDSGKSFFFTGDHEHYANIFSPEDQEYEEFEKLVAAKSANLLEFIDGVDYVVADAQYTQAEYPSRVGWGHATLDDCVALGRQANVGHLCLTHHEPTRTDDALESIFADLLHRNADMANKLSLAFEGKVIEL